MDLSNRPSFMGEPEREQAWLAASREQMSGFMLRVLGSAALPLVDAITAAGDPVQLKREAVKCAWILSKKSEPEQLEAFRANFAAVLA